MVRWLWLMAVLVSLMVALPVWQFRRSWGYYSHHLPDVFLLLLVMVVAFGVARRAT